MLVIHVHAHVKYCECTCTCTCTFVFVLLFWHLWHLWPCWSHNFNSIGWNHKFTKITPESCWRKFGIFPAHHACFCLTFYLVFQAVFVLNPFSACRTENYKKRIRLDRDKSQVLSVPITCNLACRFYDGSNYAGENYIASQTDSFTT